MIGAREPHSQDEWVNGLNQNSEMQTTIIHRDNWMNPADETQPTFVNSIKLMYKRIIPIVYSSDHGYMLSIYMKPTGTHTDNRYFYFNWSGVLT